MTVASVSLSITNCATVVPLANAAVVAGIARDKVAEATVPVNAVVPLILN